jgi:hypothetical protein
MFKSDVDIDVGDREQILKLIAHIPAIQQDNVRSRKHNTGIYVTDCPRDCLTNMASIDYQQAEQRGYFKLDILNVKLYAHIKTEAELIDLMKEPDWSNLEDREFVSKLIHLGRHYDTIRQMPEPITSIARLSMMLSVIRPAKRHLIGLSWAEVARTIWDRPNDDSYHFKRSHAIAYSHLVIVNMNMLARGYDELE